MDRRALQNAVGPDLIRAAEALDLNSAPDAFVLEAASGFSRLSMQPYPGLFLRGLPVEVAQLVVRRILDPEGTTRRFVEASLRAIGPEPQETPAAVDDRPRPFPLQRPPADHEGPEQGEDSPVAARSPEGGGGEPPVDTASPAWSRPAVLTLEEVAEVLRIKPATARRLLRDGELPARKVGKGWRILRADLERYLRR
ncbi:MAG: helix-turn-helix domain-containing protein [Thermodesulfobacteriota bacterium]